MCGEYHKDRKTESARCEIYFVCKVFLDRVRAGNSDIREVFTKKTMCDTNKPESQWVQSGRWNDELAR